MIVPSIDIRGGSAVQLVGGRDQALDAGDPMAVAERFAVAGELAVIDLDAALSTGDNREVIRRLVRRWPCRVGGGIRDVDSALDWLDQGAQSVILGTAAVPEVLSRLPKERVIAALDGIDGEVVVEGWTRPTGRAVADRLADLRDLVGGFLVTFVEQEGRLGGLDLEATRRVVADADGCGVTVAGGVRTPEDVAAADALGADVQVGMALYTGVLDLGDAVAAPLRSDRGDGLWPTVVADELGQTLGLAWSSSNSLRSAVAARRGIYHSRRRGLWEKGATSGNGQELLRVQVDCDRDALLFTVRQEGTGFCHTGDRSCWGAGSGLGRLARMVASRAASAPQGSYTARLLDSPSLLAAKLREEARELGEAEGPESVVWEAADLLYFLTVRLQSEDVGLEDVLAELDRRSLALRRRDGSRSDALVNAFQGGGGR